MANKLIIILGATASGKTRISAQLAYAIKSEIISADSRQVYKGLDIGTGKDLQDYVVDGYHVPYHLIDVVTVWEEFNLFEFQNRFYDVYATLADRNIVPVAVGGTGLYLESIIRNYHLPPAPVDMTLRKDLEKKSISELQQYLRNNRSNLHNKTDIEDRKRVIRAIEIEQARKNPASTIPERPVINSAIFGIRWERTVLRQRITARLKIRLEQGMIEEVRNLHTTGISWARLDSLGLEYRYVSRYLQNKLNYDDMFGKLNTSIHQFAKRQETWFRRMERQGIAIDWIDGENYDSLQKKVTRYLNE